MSSSFKCKLMSKSTNQVFYKHKLDEGKKSTEPIVQIASTSTRKEETTVAKRLEILQKLEKGVTIDKLATEYGLHKRTIQRYRKNIESIRKFSKNPRCLVMKRNRVPLHEDTNVRLFEWILEKQMKGDVFTDSLLQDKAKELHNKFGGSTNFTASRGWLWRFKKRYNINSSDIHEKKSEIDELTKEKLRKILSEENVNKENVYNIHETTLMWRVLPPKKLLREEESIQNEKRQDYVTIALCANATGTHKLPPLFVDKYAISQTLKYCKHTLPVIYTSQNSGFIDDVIFNDWYINHFKPNVKKHQQQKHCVGKVLLFVDNFKDHIFFEQEHQDSYFKLIVLSSDTSSNVQPMNEGIIINCKKLFRQKLFNRIHQYDDGMTKFNADYDIKDCIDLISESWDEITVTDIVNSWKKLLDQQHSEIIIKEELEQFQENIFSQKISEWVSQCDEEESTTEEITEEEETNIDHHCSIKKKEIDRMFRNLEIWAETQPDFIKLYAKVLIHYHNQH